MQVLSREESAKLTGGCLDRNYLRRKSAYMATKKKNETKK